MSKAEERLNALCKIIETKKITNQSEFIDLLEKEHQITTTQAVISRDLKKLGAVLKKKGDQRIYSLLGKDTYEEMLKLAIKDIEHNETMIVIHSIAGIADFVGDMIDAKNVDILGCISGENTIFVVPKSSKKIKETYLNLCKALYFEPGENNEN